MTTDKLPCCICLETCSPTLKCRHCNDGHYCENCLQKLIRSSQHHYCANCRQDDWFTKSAFNNIVHVANNNNKVIEYSRHEDDVDYLSRIEDMGDFDNYHNNNQYLITLYTSFAYFTLKYQIRKRNNL